MKEEALKLANIAEGLAIEIPADWSSGEPKNAMTDIADMIRKLVAELDNLEVLLDNEKTANGFLNNELDKQGEPVALGEDLDDYRMIVIAEKLGLDPMSKQFLSMPLYTAPQTKPLSDEEQTYKDLYIASMKQLHKMLGMEDDGDYRFKWVAVELAEKLDELEKLKTAPQTKPLSDEEKHKLWDSCRNGSVYDQVIAYGNAIEERILGK